MKNYPVLYQRFKTLRMNYKLLTTLSILTLFGLPLSSQITVVLPPDISICEGDQTQLISEVTGGDGNYTYIWTPSIGLSCTDCPSPIADGTSGGTTYTLTVEDGSGLQASDMMDLLLLPSPFIDVGNTIVTDILCAGELNGAIDLVADMSAAYTWTGPNGFTTTTEDLTNLQAGTYTVTVTSFDGCESTASFTVAEGGALLITGNVDVANCEEPLGATIDITVDGGISPYAYIWATGETTEDISVDVAGLYSVTVTDANGCITVQNVVVEGNPPINFNVINPPCSGSADGAIIIEPNIPSWSYEWSNGFIGSAIQGLADGTYCVTVTTDNGCVSEECVTLVSPPDMQLTVTTTDVSCANGTDGTITVFVTGGVAPYVYVWNNGTTTQTITNLAPGVYEVTVIDANGCTATINAAITEPENPLFAEIEGAPTAPCTEEFTLTAVFGGGVAPYTLLWTDDDDNVLGSDINLVNPSSELIRLAVTDDNGCTVIQQILGNFLPTVDIQTAGILSCESGTVVLDGSGSQAGPEYTYEWVGPNGIISDLSIITVDEAGTYTLTVSNPAIAGCNNSVTVEILDITTDFNGEITVNNTGCGQYTLSGNIPPDYFGQVIFEWTYPDGTTSNTALINATQSGVYTLQTDVPGLQCVFYSTAFIDLEADACATIGGFVRNDIMEMCLLDVNDPPLAGWQVIAEFGGETLTAFTDADGYYEFIVPATTGTVTATAPSGIWATCGDVFTATTPLPEGQFTNADFWFQVDEECPVLEVNLSASFLRRCFNSNYYLSVTNNGTLPAINAELNLFLDDFLSYQGATILPTGVIGQTVVWNFPEIQPGETVFILVQVYVSCDATLGQVHCSEAFVTPNPECVSADGWSGTNLELDGTCEDNDVVFTITNTGDNDLTETVNYIVIEDGVAMMQQQVLDDLGGDQLEEFSFPANGSTYTFQLSQVENHPFSELLSVSIEGCGLNGQDGFSTGFFTQFPQTSSGPNSDVLCLENIGAYDPNDKGALPVGYGEPHYIEPETEIDYRIRFQNTGTDTAFTVIIRDTLSELLDIRTLSLGNSSHSYTAEVNQGRALTFTFNNILLPDSTTNLEASQGFVDFSIFPLAEAPLESVIENSAAIYFDFNEPVITNTVFHTLGRDFLTVVNTTVVSGLDFDWEVFPNPTSSSLVVQLNGELPETSLQLVVFNALGQVEMQMNLNGQQLETSVENLATGWYHLQLRSATGEVLGYAKLIKK